jgi:CRISPR/Cas system CSM-associated protein Csm3 (group 7 of RAMP superfamily)
MVDLQFKIHLLSDTTFGRGDGVAGLVDQEVEHDSSGFPYLRGRTLKGLISEECDNIISVLPTDLQTHWWAIAAKLFGVAGSTSEAMGEMHVGDACLPDDLRQAVSYQLQQPSAQLTKQDILSTLTTIRRQTAIDPVTSASDKNSLRSMRVILRDLEFTSVLSFEGIPTEDMKNLLAIGALALRHLGESRNRGKGHVRCTLCNDRGQDITPDLAIQFHNQTKQS